MRAEHCVIFIMAKDHRGSSRGEIRVGFLHSENRKEQEYGVQKSQLCGTVLVHHKVLASGKVPQEEVIPCPGNQ